MWWTPLGDRVLRGAEWELFREGLDILWDHVEESADDPDAFDSGVEAFDRLQVGQKLALLALVGRALSDEGVPHPDLTVNTEAAVAAVFGRVVGEMAMEVDLANDPGWVKSLDSPGEATHWRRLVLAAHLWAESRDEDDAEAPAGAGGEPGSDGSPGDEGEEDGPWSPPDVLSGDLDDWEFVVEGLANRVLWEDGDHEAGDDFLDADPAEGRARMAMMGIAEDYYTDVAADPTEEQLGPIRQLLRSVCGRPEPKEPEDFGGLLDAHHDLLVGPCEAGTIAEEVACRLVREVVVSGEGGFDCSHAEWAGLFREEVRRVDSAESSGSMVPEVVLSAGRMMEAARARESGEPLLLDDGLRIEPRGDVWIVVDRQGCVLSDVEEAEWDGGVGDPPPVEFATPAEAIVGGLRAELIAAARSERYEAAMKRLGRG